MTKFRPSGKLTEQRAKDIGSQFWFNWKESPTLRKVAKIGGVSLLGAGLVVAGLAVKNHYTTKEKNIAVQEVAVKEQTLEQTANNYVAKAQDMMRQSDVSTAIDFVAKAEDLKPGIQYAAIASDLSSAKDLKVQYDDRNEKVKALISEQKYDIALKVLGQDNVYDPNNDKMIYSQKVLAKKMGELGVDVVEHTELEGKINHLVQVRDEKKALTSQAIALSKKLKDTQHTLTMDNATLDGAVDSAVSIFYRVTPASDLSGASVTIGTKKGTKMVLKDDDQKFLYHVAVKLENILPDRYFGASQLSQLFQSGDLTSLKIEENSGAYTFTFMDNKRKEKQYKIDPRFTVQIAGVMNDINGYKGVTK